MCLTKEDLKQLQHNAHAINGMRIHSPYIYYFYWDIILGKRFRQGYGEVLHPYLRSLRDCERRLIPRPDANNQPEQDTIRKGSLNQKQATFFYRLANKLAPSIIFDLGSPCGIAAASMALGAPEAIVVRIGTHRSSEQVIRDHLTQHNIPNVEFISGMVPDIIYKVWDAYPRPDIVFLDPAFAGDYLMEIAERILPRLQQGSVFVVNQIHSSKWMEETWDLLKCLPEVTASIDIYTMGILFVSEELSSQHFRLRW